jgi:hypothetical protein
MSTTEKPGRFSGHTARPWTTSRTDGKSFTGNPDAPEDGAVHVVYVYRGNAPRAAFYASREEDRARADAELSAAAPDLLDAIKRASDLLYTLTASAGGPLAHARMILEKALVGDFTPPHEQPRRRTQDVLRA